MNTKLSDTLAILAGALREAEKLPLLDLPETLGGELKRKILHSVHNQYIPELLGIPHGCAGYNEQSTENPKDKWGVTLISMKVGSPSQTMSVSFNTRLWVKAYLYSALVALGKMLDAEDDHLRMANLIAHIAIIYGTTGAELDAMVDQYIPASADTNAIVGTWQLLGFDEMDIVRKIGNYYRYNTDIDIIQELLKLAVWLRVYSDIKLGYIEIDFNTFGAKEDEHLQSESEQRSD